MKTVLAILLFVGSVFAQIQDTSVGAPMQLGGNPTGGMTCKNTASKEILALTISYGPGTFIFGRDFYFMPEGIKPGDTRVMIELAELPANLVSQITSGKVVYVQFIDGTEWGDVSWRETGRQAYSALYSQIVSAYGTGGQSAVETLLNNTANDPKQNPLVSGMAGSLLTTEKAQGIDKFISTMNLDLASAAAHDKTMNH